MSGQVTGITLMHLLFIILIIVRRGLINAMILLPFHVFVTSMVLYIN